MRSTLPILYHTRKPHCRDAVVFIDGSCPKNPGPMGIGYSMEIHEPDSDLPAALTQCGFRLGPGTNNKAEYHSLLYALREALRSGVTHIRVYTDSMVLTGHLTKSWKVCRSLRLLNAEAKTLLGMFSEWSVSHIDREDNDQADFLSKNPTEPILPPSDIEIDLTLTRQRKLSRRQAALVRWWWKTGRCRSPNVIARIFGTPKAFSQYGRIGSGEVYRDLTEGDLGLAAKDDTEHSSDRDTQEEPGSVTTGPAYWST